MNLAELLLRKAINTLSNLSNETLQQYFNINKNINPILLLGNLFYDCSIQYNYAQMKNYISKLNLNIFNNINYTIQEQAWIKFYLLYKFNKGTDKFKNEILNDYKNLPHINSNNKYILEIQELLYAYINYPI